MGESAWALSPEPAAAHRFPENRVHVRFMPGASPRLASFDHRDAVLNRQFVIAYAPCGDSQPSSRLGRFISTVRNGYHGRWRVLEATTQPYG